MAQVTLVGLPPGAAHAYDPETGTTFERDVTVEVDDATAARLISIAQFGFTFYTGDPAAFEIVASPDLVPNPPVLPEVTAADPTPAAFAASPQ